MQGRIGTGRDARRDRGEFINDNGIWLTPLAGPLPQWCYTRLSGFCLRVV